ncbi:MAG: hypothetical protein NTV24_04410 [Candidatus Woesebacteria bacterium]|nr:hypothetical protein [Candidatus Woesebacteria bacterium]
MSYKTICDICNKEIKSEEEFGVRSYFVHYRHYCQTCWLNIKRWPQIHSKQKEED